MFPCSYHINWNPAAGGSVECVVQGAPGRLRAERPSIDRHDGVPWPETGVIRG